jgi:hypothetical protein
MVRRAEKSIVGTKIENIPVIEIHVFLIPANR